MTKRRITGPDGSERIEVEVEDEVTPQDRRSNADVLKKRASDALQTNRDFLATERPTPSQTSAQVRHLTEECSALIRLLLGRLEGTD